MVTPKPPPLWWPLFIQHFAIPVILAFLLLILILKAICPALQGRAERKRRAGFYAASESKWRSRFYCAECNPIGTASRPASMRACPYCGITGYARP